MRSFPLLVCCVLAVACEGCASLLQRQPDDVAAMPATPETQEPAELVPPNPGVIPPRFSDADSLHNPLSDFLQTTARTTVNAVSFVPDTFDFCLQRVEKKACQFDDWSDQFAVIQATKGVIYGTAAVALFCAQLLGSGRSGGWGGGFGR